VSKRLPVKQLKTRTNELSLGSAKTFHLPDWSNLDHPQRLGIIRQIAMMRGRDPRIAQFVVRVLKACNVEPRDYVKQAAALLAWVQTNIYYVNEPGERLQDPIYTLKARFADCDDSVILLAAFFESIGAPWKLVLSGKKDGKKVRYIEGDPLPPGVSWAHIYLMVGTPTFNPIDWYFCETTIKGVPLGWDVVNGDASYLPEMMTKKPDHPSRLMGAPPPPPGYRPAPLPAEENRSPAYDFAASYGSFDADFDLLAASTPSVGRYYGPIAGGASAGRIIAEPTKGDEKGMDWAKITTGIVTGVAVSVATSLLLDWVNGKGMWSESGGHIVQRWRTAAEPTLQHSTFVAPSPVSD
jgi:hypothetical protein